MSTLSDPLGTDQVKTPDQLQLISTALRIRVFEQKLLQLFGAGHIRGTVHTCLGQELLAAAVSHLLSSDDWLFGTHRGHGYYLSLTGDYKGLAREILGRQKGVSRGIGGSQHLHARGIITNGVQGGLVPVAAGTASGLEDSIAVAVIGDGTLGQGVLYETLNIASLQQTPLLILIEDNEIAQSTPQVQNVAGSIRARFEAFGWPLFEATDEELTSLQKSASDAIHHVREHRSPAALHVKTRRLGPHSKGDDNRSTALIRELHTRDYLNRLVANSADVTTEAAMIDTEIQTLLDSILLEPPATDVPVKHRLSSQLKKDLAFHTTTRITPGTIRQQTTLALKNCLASTINVWLIGEDVEHLPSSMERGYSGAFGVSDDLSVSHPGQVRNFPISEQAITGFGIGRALSGNPTIVEIMFGDFTTLVLDQIRQQASKLSGVYRDPVSLPFILRTPMGGRRGYGPTHSQSYEGLFFGIPNILVYAHSPFGISDNVYERFLELQIPVIVLENKDLYSLSPRTEVSNLYEVQPPTNAQDPWRVTPVNHEPSVTVVTYGFAAELVLRSLERLARQAEIFVEVLVFEVLSPFDVSALVRSLANTKRLSIVEEGMPEMGITSTVMTALSASNFNGSFSISTLGAESDIGASAASEASALINEERIMGRIRQLVDGR